MPQYPTPGGGGQLRIKSSAPSYNYFCRPDANNNLGIPISTVANSSSAYTEICPAGSMPVPAILVALAVAPYSGSPQVGQLDVALGAAGAERHMIGLAYAQNSVSYNSREIWLPVPLVCSGERVSIRLHGTNNDGWAAYFKLIIMQPAGGRLEVWRPA